MARVLNRQDGALLYYKGPTRRSMHRARRWQCVAQGVGKASCKALARHRAMRWQGIAQGVGKASRNVLLEAAAGQRQLKLKRRKLRQGRGRNGTML